MKHDRLTVALAALATALTDTLRERGVADPAATLVAEAGIAVFKVAYQRWVDRSDDSGETLAQLIRQSLAELKTVTAAS